MTGHILFIATCCREWLCLFGYPLGSCGLCGERPTFTRFESDESPYE